MKFNLDAVFIEQGERESALARRVVAALPERVPVEYIADGREAARARVGADPFDAGKRRMVLMRRRAPFLMTLPRGLGALRVLRIPGDGAGVELPDGLQLLLSAGVRRR